MSLQQTITAFQPGEAEARLAKALADLERERTAVGEIQRSLLPASLPEIPGFEMSPYYRPSEQAGGDYYDVVPLINDQWGFIMADVAGHGTPAAVIMTAMRTLIHAELPNNRGKSAAEFLEHVNKVMSRTYLRNGLFVTMWAAVLNPFTRELSYSSAGHNPPRLLRGRDVLELDRARGIPLGIEPQAAYENQSLTLEQDDLLVIYTDGITEAMRPGRCGRELFGTDRLDRVLSECGRDPASACTDHLTNALADFTNGAPATDDRTMLVVRASGYPSNRIEPSHKGSYTGRTQSTSRYHSPIRTRPGRLEVGMARHPLDLSEFLSKSESLQRATPRGVPPCLTPDAKRLS